MADTKVSALTADASPTTDDLIYVVNDPGGTPASRKVTLGNTKALFLTTGSTDNAILRADGTGGSALQSSGVTISDDNDITIAPDATPNVKHITVGDQTASNTNGNILYITGGLGNGTGAGGRCEIAGGAGGATNGSGGLAGVLGGDAVGNGTGGDVFLQPGSSPSGTEGKIKFGDASAAGGFTITFDTTNISTDRTIFFPNSSTTLMGLSTVQTVTGAKTFANTGFKILDTNASHALSIVPGSDLSAARTLTVTTGDTDMIVDFTAVTDEYVLAYDTGTNTWRGVAASGGGASTALDNLASVAINTTLVSDTYNTDALGTSAIAWSDLFLGNGAVIEFSSAASTPDVTITHSSNTLTIAGGTLALGAENLTMTGSIAATGARVTKGWFTDIESTNMPTVGGTSLSSTFLGLAGGTMTGNITLGENTSIALDPAGSADGKYTGITIAGTAGAALAFGDLCYLAVADSRWELTDADAASTSGDVMLGMCVLAAAGDGSATVMLLQGTCRADAAFPALTIGAPVYVSTTAGDIQVAQPSGADDVIRRVGFALTADEIYFNPSNDYITHT